MVEENRQYGPWNNEPLDFFRGMQFLKGLNFAEATRRRQLARTEEARLAFIAARERMDSSNTGPLVA